MDSGVCFVIIDNHERYDESSMSNRYRANFTDTARNF